MRLWTFQSPQVYQKLRDGQVFHCKRNLSGSILHRDFRQAYEWMAERMMERIDAPPEGAELPIWAWHTWDWKHKRPDLRRSEFRYHEDMYLLELEVPNYDVLLSDEEAWHAVLNKCYLNPATNETEWEQWEAAFDVLPLEKQQQAMLLSWDAVFDTVPYKSLWTWKGRYIQATIWEIREKQLLNAHKVNAKQLVK